ncbi:DNA polymerase IV [Candidatus Uhrbacteria bacterium]|nr:DNA polymerase IV [Candidatus Uhrbacteria bacterium]
MPLVSYPRAIIHLDGDAFFASCEQAINPRLRGKPVVTGAERGIVTAASYEAKAKGVGRGVPLSQVKKLCPDVIFVESHYDVYEAFAERMFSIMRRYTPHVEEYSIDEAFADITGFDKAWHRSYEQIALRMKEVIEKELELTVSVGLSLTKVLAKIGSKYKKPSGFTPIPRDRLSSLLRETPIHKVWGIGPSTVFTCHRLGIRTAFDFAQTPLGRIQDAFNKPHQEIWRELNGEAVFPLVTDPKTSYDSISRFETFRPPTRDRHQLFSRLVNNLEHACAKARRYHLVAPRITVLLRLQNMRTRATEITLPRPTALPPEIISHVERGFTELYDARDLYRATGIALFSLRSQGGTQASLFESVEHVDKWKQVYAAIDRVNAKQGPHMVHLANTSLLRSRQNPLNPRANF